MSYSFALARVGVLLSSVGTLACAHAAAWPPLPNGLSLDWTPTTCARATADADRDGMDDRCELALAQAFAPLLVVDRRDCLWRDGVDGAGLGGGYLFAAQRTPGGVRIAYLPAYYRDCGWTGPVCRTRGPGCAAHAGDSELILVDVAATDDRWATVGVFLSAHCFGRSDGRCRWYRGEALSAFGWVDGIARGAPRVWVARGKHGHYPSRRSCDGGHWFFDSCDGNAAAVRFPVRSARQNIGSRRRPAPAPDGCVARERLPLGPADTDGGTRECLWQAEAPFWGWQADRSGTAPTSYARYLAQFAGY